MTIIRADEMQAGDKIAGLEDDDVIVKVEHYTADGAVHAIVRHGAGKTTRLRFRPDDAVVVRT